MPVKVLISGVSGRMGQTLTEMIALDPEFALVGGTDRKNKPTDSLLEQADVIIDFSAVPALQTLLSDHKAALRGRALVVGTTGLTKKVTQLLDELSREAAVLVAPNFSVGVNLLLGLVDAAARVLPASEFDVEIIEAHHRRKLDAPSGTALALGEAVARARNHALSDVRQDGRSGHTGERVPGTIGIHALRGGDIVGEHRVLFIGPHERIELAHMAQDRRLFAQGALLAARWIKGRAPGRYTMKEVLGLGG